MCAQYRKLGSSTDKGCMENFGYEADTQRRPARSLRGAPPCLIAAAAARARFSSGLRNRDIDDEDVDRIAIYLDLRRLDLLGVDLAALPCPARMMVLAVLLTASRSAVSAMCEYRWVVR
jgi:hypothetical protein